MQKSPITSNTELPDALRHGQFQQSVNPTPRPRRPRREAIVIAAVLLLVLATTIVWLLPRLTASGATASHNTPTPPTMPATPMPTTVPATPTPPATPSPTPGLTQQYAFTAADSGRTVRFGITTRFSLTLNQQAYPRANLQLVCDPQDAAGTITNTPYASPPLYAVEYEVNAAGSCTIQDGSFTLAVIIES